MCEILGCSLPAAYRWRWEWQTDTGDGSLDVLVLIDMCTAHTAERRLLASYLVPDDALTIRSLVGS